MRKAEFAEVIARTMQSNQTTDGVVDAMHADETKAVAATSAELGRSRTRVATQRVALEAQGAALKDEKARREEAEKRAAQAAADLAKFATVKQEPRGMVITLSGSVLFASAKWDLLPAAQLKLNDVANALTKEDHIEIVVEVTTTAGAAGYNQSCRSNARKPYATNSCRGYRQRRIVAQGFGPTRSIADNRRRKGA